MNHDLYTNYLIIPLLICCARVTDVSLGTIRIIMISRGNRLLAGTLGFFEVIIWLVAITQVLHNLTNVASYLAYGLGFALGNFSGITIENKLALGAQAIQIVTHDNFQTLSMLLREEGFGVTKMVASGQKGQLDFLYVVVPRKKVKHVLDIVKDYDPNAFISITDVRNTYSGFIQNQRRKLWPKDIIKKK
ncbi:hypothetical protein DRI50_07770 [candidate division KSB1 bacterium]|nr:MAG: hypothetical protein DRI50_07770 [candidate division KSB1 bacterium]